MGRVADLLATKGSQVHSVPRHAMVHDAVTRMVQFNVGSVVVLDGTLPAGIFTERDCLHRVTLERLDPRITPVGHVMNTELVRVDAGRTIPECMTIMTQSRIRHLLVVDGDRVLGLISIGDVVKHLSREQESEIEHLTRYITG
jgi:CBS domain-containing protein